MSTTTTSTEGSVTVKEKAIKKEGRTASILDDKSNVCDDLKHRRMSAPPTLTPWKEQSRRTRSLSASSSSIISAAHACAAHDDETLEDLKDTLRLRQQMLGDRHPKVGLAANEVGNCHFRRGELEEAEKAYKRALDCYIAAPGYEGIDCHGESDSSDPENGISERRRSRGDDLSTSSSSSSSADQVAVAVTLGNMGAVHWKAGRFNQSIECLRESLSIHSSAFATLGEYCSTELSNALYNLGLARCLRGEYGEAMDALSWCRRARSSALGADHVETARAVDAMGKVHLLRGDAEKAMECHRDALRVKCKAMGSRHPSVVRSMMNVAATHSVMGEHAAALAVYREALRAQKATLPQPAVGGVDDANGVKSALVDVGMTLRLIGNVHREMGNATEATAAFKDSLATYKEAGLAEDDERVVALRSCIPTD